MGALVFEARAQQVSALSIRLSARCAQILQFVGEDIDEVTGFMELLKSPARPLEGPTLRKERENLREGFEQGAHGQFVVACMDGIDGIIRIGFIHSVTFRQFRLAYAGGVGGVFCSLALRPKRSRP